MNKVDLQYIKENYKWRFVWTDIFNRYFILITPIFFIFLSLMISYFSIKNNTDNSYLLVTVPIFLFGTALFYFTVNRIESERKFKTIPIQPNCNLDLKNYFNQLGWTINLSNEKLITGSTKISLFSWGETITIIINEDFLLINSRPMGRQPFTLNRDKVNYQKLYNLLTNPQK